MNKELNVRAVKQKLLNSTIYIVLVVLLLVIIAIEPKFLSIRNFTFILQQAAPRIVLALASASICIIGGRDMSTGRQIGLSAIICSVLLQAYLYQTTALSCIPIFPACPFCCRC